MRVTLPAMTVAARQTQPTFGRRNRTSPAVVARKQGRAPGRSPQASNGLSHMTFEARHTIKPNLVAFALLLAGGGAIKDLMESGEEVFGMALGGFEQVCVWLCALGIIFIGLYWVYKSLCRAPAIRMTTTGITGYTFYGIKTVNWPDVDRVTKTNDDNYGVVLNVFAKRRSGLFGFLPKGFAMPIGLTDSTIEDISAALQVHRPDLHVI